MSDLTLKISVRDATKGITLQSDSLSVTTGDGEESGSVTTAVGESTWTFSTQVTSGGNGPGLLVLQNLDATDSIHIGLQASAAYQITLDPAGSASGISWAVLPMHAGKLLIYTSASANTPQLYYTVYERNA